MGAPFKDESIDCAGLGKNLKVCRHFGDPAFADDRVTQEDAAT